MMVHLMRFANTLANKSIVETLPEHEALAYIQLCRLIESMANRLRTSGDINGSIEAESSQ